MASDPSAKSVFERVLLALQSAGVPYMLTGSFASAFHGSPRTTQDIDIVIAPTLGSLNAMLKLFPSDSYYVSREAALQAYGNEGLFNVIDFESGWKIDLIIRKSRPFSLEEFDRRREVLLLGTSVEPKHGRHRLLPRALTCTSIPRPWFRAWTRTVPMTAIFVVMCSPLIVIL